MLTLQYDNPQHWCLAGFGAWRDLVPGGIWCLALGKLRRCELTGKARKIEQWSSSAIKAARTFVITTTVRANERVGLVL